MGRVVRILLEQPGAPCIWLIFTATQRIAAAASTTSVVQRWIVTVVSSPLHLVFRTKTSPLIITMLLHWKIGLLVIDPMTPTGLV